MRTMRRPLPWLVLILALSAYAIIVEALNNKPHFKEQDALRTAIPPFIQVFVAGGDKYLAANIAVFRAVILSTSNLTGDDYRILSRVQSDAARLNPAHEDNYYTSQAILPWEGEIAADVFIQAEATRVRTWDSLPPFFLGFDYYYFLHNPVLGARTLQIAADRAPANYREALIAMSARWYEKGDDPKVAINVISAMIKSTRDKEVKRNLEMRLARMQSLVRLREVAKTFVAKYKHPPQKLEDLVGPDLLDTLPVDPLGQGFVLDATGLPVIALPKRANAK